MLRKKTHLFNNKLVKFYDVNNQFIKVLHNPQGKNKTAPRQLKHDYRCDAIPRKPNGTSKRNRKYK